MILGFVFWLLSLNPCEAAQLAADGIGRPDLGAFLHRTAQIESRCKFVSRHDSRSGARRYDKLSEKVHAAAVKRGWLDPIRCPGHRWQKGRPWATIGGLGAFSAWTHRHLGFIGCVLGPELHVIPIVAAFAAAGHAEYLSDKYNTRDHAELRLLWAGQRKRSEQRDEVIARWNGDK